MKRTTVFAICLACTTLLVGWRFTYLPALLPMAQANVRTAAAQAVEELRHEGLWAIDARLQGVREKESEVCFDWHYRYRSRLHDSPPVPHETCVAKR